MKLTHINLIAWKMLRHNSDKNAFFLDITTIFCLSLCIGVMAALNSIFAGVIEKQENNLKNTVPLIYVKVSNLDSFLKLQEGLTPIQQEYIEKINIPGLSFIDSQKNTIIDKNKQMQIISLTKGKAKCFSDSETKNYTIYDISQGFNILGLPAKSATFTCEWIKSSYLSSVIMVPEKIWKHVYGDKFFSYDVNIEDINSLKENIDLLEKKLKQTNFNLGNVNYAALSIIKESMRIKKIFALVFILLCLILFSMMIMNSMIFIKSRKDDWEVFYTLKIKSKDTNLIIALRFFYLFSLTVAFSAILTVLIAEVSTRVITYLDKGAELPYTFTFYDISFSYLLLIVMFIASIIFTSKRLKKGDDLISYPSKLLSINNLNVTHNSVTNEKNSILNELNIQVPEYKITGIIGISGSGKTTLLNSIFNNKFLDKQIFIDIENTAYVTQYPNLIQELTIKENLKVFSTTDSLISLCQVFGIEHILKHYPNECSAGEKQRICMVRALLTNPHNLILDEVTASLDLENKIKCFNIFRELITNKKINFVLIVTHDPDIIALCDELYELKKGILTKIVNSEHIIAV